MLFNSYVFLHVKNWTVLKQKWRVQCTLHICYKFSETIRLWRFLPHLLPPSVLIILIKKKLKLNFFLCTFQFYVWKIWQCTRPIFNQAEPYIFVNKTLLHKIYLRLYHQDKLSPRICRLVIRTNHVRTQRTRPDSSKE